jgi:hypothetical protein
MAQQLNLAGDAFSIKFMVFSEPRPTAWLTVARFAAHFVVLPLQAALSILMAGKVDRQHVHNSDGLAENLFGGGGQIVGIIRFDFCGAVLVWHEHVQNTVVNAFHPHPEAKSVKFARADQGIQHCSNRKLLVSCGVHIGLLKRPIYPGWNEADMNKLTRIVATSY